MSNIYDRGDLVRLSAGFADIDGTPGDPSTVTLRVKKPDATVTVHTYPGDVTKSGTGTYYFDLPLTDSGDWYYRFEGTGAVQAAGEQGFHVYRSNVL
ncbi:MAG: hypothetical protein AB7H77_01280 [Bdellovibrionales bacterium]